MQCIAKFNKDFADVLKLVGKRGKVSTYTAELLKGKSAGRIEKGQS